MKTKNENKARREEVLWTLATLDEQNKELRHRLHINRYLFDEISKIRFEARKNEEADTRRQSERISDEVWELRKLADELKESRRTKVVLDVIERINTICNNLYDEVYKIQEVEKQQEQIIAEIEEGNPPLLDIKFDWVESGVKEIGHETANCLATLK